MQLERNRPQEMYSFRLVDQRATKMFPRFWGKTKRFTKIKKIILKDYNSYHLENFLSYLFLEFPLPVLLDEPLPATLYGSSSLLPAPTPFPMLTCWRSCCRLSRTPPPRLITSTMKISFIGWTYREILNNIGIKDGVIAFCMS